MKRPACWEFVLILGFHCLQGRRQWQGQYSSLCIADLLFSPSLCVLFLSLDLCSVFPLFFSPVSGFSSGFSFSSAPPCFRLSLVLCFQCSVFFCSVFLLSVFALFFWVPFSPPLVLGFLLPFIEKLALPPVLPLQDCYGIHERDSGQETWSMIGFVADYQLPC